jgi:hypothetical protein
MRHIPLSRILVLLLLALSLAIPPSGATRALAQDNGLEGDNTYASPQFGYSVTWGDDWQARARDVISNPGGYDTLTLRSDLGILWIQGQGDSESAARAVERRISIEGSPDEVVAQDLEGEVPMAEMLVGRNKVLIEGYTLDGIDAVVVIVLSARERTFDDALASVHEQVLFNDGPILTGVTIDEIDDGELVDLTATETPVEVDATEEPRDGVDAEPTREMDDGTGSGIDDGVYTSQLYDYRFAFDEDVWAVEEELSSESTDGLLLLSETGTLTIWSWDVYGADAEGCLDGEDQYYSTDDASISDWRQARDASGNRLEGSGEGYAWAVFTLTFTDEDGSETRLVDYIECREIPGDDAVVIVFATTTPDLYPEHLEAILEVVDSIEIEGELLIEEPVGREEEVATGEPVATEEPVVTEEPIGTEEPETGLSGSLFTSPVYGYTVDIPANWGIVSVEMTPTEDIIELTNGTSDVRILATDAYGEGSLGGCVDFAAEESGLDLEVDINADGEPFRNEGRMKSYANFLYTDETGQEMTHFISCQHIVEGESVLIISQDVPYDEFANQRKFRAELEDSITIPGQ